VALRQEANVAIIEDLVRGIAVGVRNFVLENRGDIFSCIPSVPLTTHINIEKGGIGHELENQIPATRMI